MAELVSLSKGDHEVLIEAGDEETRSRLEDLGYSDTAKASKKTTKKKVSSK